MKIKEVTQEQLTQFFLEDPALVCLALGDEEIYHLHTKQEYPVNTFSRYTGVIENNQIIAIVRTEWFTPNATTIHIYVASRFHDTAKVQEIMVAIRQELKNVPQLKKIIIMTPASCEHVSKYAMRYGFKEEGRITDCIMWRQQLDDIRIFVLEN